MFGTEVTEDVLGRWAELLRLVRAATDEKTDKLAWLLRVRVATGEKTDNFAWLC